MSRSTSLEAEGLVPATALGQFLAARGLPGRIRIIEPIGDGHSNLTFGVDVGDRRVVLRRPPRPPYAPSAHDVLREARILQALHRAGLRVPAVVATSDDPSILGVPFFVMEHVEGYVVAEHTPDALNHAPGRRALGQELVDALVELHGADPGAAGLGPPERADSYLERQLRRFAQTWQRERTRDIPAMDRVTRWLVERAPRSRSRAIVHGDYRLGNAMFAAEPRVRLVAVLDWEMAALGDPLADVGYLMATWAQPEDPDNPMLDLSRATRAPGFLTRAELRERYETRSGRRTDGIEWYEVLALWKAAVFLEASHRRYREGRATDPYFARLERGVPLLAAAADAHARQAKGRAAGLLS